MDGRMNCHLTAENAAFTKIRQLEKRVDETDKELDNVKQQVSANTNAFNEHITQTSERVETRELSATSVTAANANITNAEAGSLNATDVTATTIDAGTINVDNLENVNVLHGKTVDVDKTIATIGQFVETHTTGANNVTTNTDTLNVSTEANLTGQVNIDGNLTFTKDNGLSKLQGNYLEVDAANVVIENKNKEAYALKVPGINGQALFGGSVTVQDTLTAKNLLVVGDALLKGLKLDESTVLTNPTFKGITGTNELTTSALVVDSEGKLVSKKISSEVEGSVASSLVCKKEIVNATLLDEWKPTAGNSVYKTPVSSTAQFVMSPISTSGEVLLTNENGSQIKVSDLGVKLEEAAYSIVHRNFVYIIHPTIENGNTFKCVIIPINTNTMEVSPSFDITQYFGQVSSSDFSGSAFEVLIGKVTYQPAVLGPVLSEDVPTIGFIGTNTYINLSTMEVNTRDTAFGDNWYVLTKNNRWIELSGSPLGGDLICTNGKYSSVEDAALGVPGCQYILDPDTNKISQQMFYVDAPLWRVQGNSLIYSDGGNIKEVAFTDIPGYSRYESEYGTVDKDGNPVHFGPLFVTVSSSSSNSSLYLTGGYYPRDYFNTTTSYVETIVIDDTKVEVNGSTFVDGVWYDKVVNSVNDLIAFITKQKDKKRYKVLFTGYTVKFDTTDTSQFPKVFTENDIYGTFDIYHLRDDSRTFALELTGVPGNATKISKLIDACHWHGFYTNVSLLFCNEALNKILAIDNESVSYLHINDCQLSFNKTNTGRNSKYYLGISDSSNVTYSMVDIPENLFSDAENKNVDLTLTNCYNIVFNDYNSGSKVLYNYSKMLFSFSDRCEANIYSTMSQVSEQCGPGYNLEYNAAGNAGAKFRTPTLKYRANPYR